jgi:hypothetical protein
MVPGWELTLRRQYRGGPRLVSDANRRGGNGRVDSGKHRCTDIREGAFIQREGKAEDLPATSLISVIERLSLPREKHGRLGLLPRADFGALAVLPVAAKLFQWRQSRSRGLRLGRRRAQERRPRLASAQTDHHDFAASSDTRAVPVSAIRKRDGQLAAFDAQKISRAILKAGKATGEFEEDVAQTLTVRVLGVVQMMPRDDAPSVEEIQNIVEETLLASPFKKTAKAYILYRDQHARNREMIEKADLDLIDSYLGQFDWRVRENSNMAYSLQGLNNYVSSEISKVYWLNKKKVRHTDFERVAVRRGEGLAMTWRPESGLGWARSWLGSAGEGITMGPRRGLLSVRAR